MMSTVTLKRKPPLKVRKQVRNLDRSKKLTMRLSESERAIIEERAAELGLTMSDYIRDKIIHEET